MKKLVTLIAVVLVMASVVCIFVACSDKKETLSVSSYDIEETTVNVGDVHGKPTITANMSDGTTKTVSNNLVFDEEDVAKLELDDDNKYQKSGEFAIKVYILEQQDKFYLGEWKITVKTKKN